MRLFIAINFDENTIAELESYQKDLMDAGIDGNFTPPENLHLTLAFIGDYGKPDEILDIMENVSFEACDVRVEKIELYRDMYFADITNHPALQSYVRRLRRELSDAGIPFDRKKFKPHITLARKAVCIGKRPVIEWEGSDYAISINRISLMSSRRGKRGMIYTELGSVWADDSEDI